jgi:hypothetical protein
MDFKIPQILDLEINWLAVCAPIPFSSLPSILKKEKKGSDKEAIYDGEHWIHLDTDTVKKDSKNHIHFHIDVVRKPPLWNPKKPRKPNSTLQKIIEAITPFEGMLLNVYVRCDFLISRDTLPKRGLASSILGLSTRIMNAKLNFIGAEMSIQEAPPYNEISWGLISEEEDYITAKIEFRQQQVKFDDNYLVKLAEIAREGIDRFLLERKKENVTNS